MTLAGALDALHFLRPGWLWGLLLLPVVAWAWGRRWQARDAWRPLVDAHLLPHLLATEPRARRGRPLPVLLACIAAALAVLALAGPSWQRSPQPAWEARSPVVVALDLSGSTRAADLPPSRLAQARAALARWLERRQDGDVGLVVYAEQPFVVAPITRDARNVALFLDALATDLMPGERDAPSRADRAIALAMQLLQQAGHQGGDIVLIEDAAGDAALEAARAASAAGFRVSVLGLGTAAGAAWRDTQDGIRRTALDADSLRALARAGDGGFVPLAGDDPFEALGLLEPRQGGERTAAGAGAQAWQDQGYWLLLPLLLLVAWAFRRGAVFGVLIACAVLPWPRAHAADLSSPWKRQDQQVHARMTEGARAYRNGDYAAALRAWDGLPGADAAYNRGNALAREGRLAEAIGAYDRALQLRPGMPDALANRRAVEQILRQQAPNDGKGDAGKEKPEGDTPAPAQAPAGQAEADDAQRQRMQDALEPGEQARTGDTGQAMQGDEPRETRHELERRLSDEALLRRIPDDPGGLLRARFQLEYERRQGQESP